MTKAFGFLIGDHGSVKSEHQPNRSSATATPGRLPLVALTWASAIAESAAPRRSPV